MIDSHTNTLLREFVSLLSEGRFENTTTVLSRQCVNSIKHLIKTRAKTIVPDEWMNIEFPVIENGKNVATFIFSIGFYSEMNPNKMHRIDGQAERTWSREILMQVRVSFPAKILESDEWEKWINPAFIMSLKGTIRHELEHVGQEMKGEIPAVVVNPDFNEVPNDDDGLKHWMSYFMQPHEVKALTMELYKKAKTLKQPLGFAIEMAIKNRSRRWNEEAFAPLKAALIAYAKERLPAADMSTQKRTKATK